MQSCFKSGCNCLGLRTLHLGQPAAPCARLTSVLQEPPGPLLTPLTPSHPHALASCDWYSPCSPLRSLLQADEAYVCQLALGGEVMTAAKPCPSGTTPLTTKDESTGETAEM